MNAQYTLTDYYKDQILRMDLDELYEERSTIDMELEQSFYQSKWGETEVEIAEIGNMIDGLIEAKEKEKVL